jgi:hypothetical protein
MEEARGSNPLTSTTAGQSVAGLASAVLTAFLGPRWGRDRSGNSSRRGALVKLAGK